MPMNGNLVDTNVFVKVLRGDTAAKVFFDGLDEVYISATILGELLYGAKKSAKSEANIALIEQLVNGVKVLILDDETAAIYAHLKNELIKTGFNLPENDMWIAAVAKQHDLAVATYDSHFKHIKTIETIYCNE
jgi:tRNA(fMet)-specific endonuclease VapC